MKKVAIALSVSFQLEVIWVMHPKGCDVATWWYILVISLGLKRTFGVFPKYFQKLHLIKNRSWNYLTIYQEIFSFSLRRIYEKFRLNLNIGFEPFTFHYVKSVRIRSYSSPYFSHIFPHSDCIFSPNAGKCG